MSTAPDIRATRPQIDDRGVWQALESANWENRVDFAFQPVIAVGNGAVDYYECLLRMRSDSGAAIATGEFVREVEELGLAGTLDRLVLGKAIEELVRYPNIRLGFNISGMTAANRTWLTTFLAEARDRQSIMPRVMVEITETAALANLDEAARFVRTLREAGARVALDDFGAGYTSLRCLQHLTVNAVKIDGSFVRGLSDDPESRVFLRHLLNLARSLGLATIAESVETPEQLAILRQEGVEYLQGHYWGEPTIRRPWHS